jgi:hypothetical protein
MSVARSLRSPVFAVTLPLVLLVVAAAVVLAAAGAVSAAAAGLGAVDTLILAGASSMLVWAAVQDGKR